MKARIILLAAAVCFSTLVKAQATVISNNSSNTDDYLGWDALTTIPLDIKHENNRNIRFSTNGVLSWGVRSSGFVLGGTLLPIEDAPLSVLMDNHPTTNYGIYARGNGAEGGLFVSINGQTNVGFGARSTATDEALFFNVGVFGSLVSCPGAGQFGAAIYGTTRDCPGSSWGGYFNGKTFCTMGIWSASDEQLKINVQPLLGASDMLASLEPHQYEFLPQNDNDLTLPEGLQYGLMAQELQAVIPSAVSEVIHTGGLAAPSAENAPLEFKAVNYQLLIPVLIAHFQEQQTSLQDAQAKLSVLEEELYHIENRVAIEKYQRAHSE